jgi:hypothetical protein
MERKELIEKLQAKHAAAVERARATLVEIAGLPGYQLELGSTDLFRQLSEDWKRLKMYGELIQEMVPFLFQEPETNEARSKRLHAEAGSMGLTLEQTKEYVRQGMVNAAVPS